jgi:hypothetical protein
MTTIRRHGPAAIISLVAVIALTWPLPARFATVLPESRGVGDGLMHAWNVWWFKEALLAQRTNPYWSGAIYYPQGASLYFHTLGLGLAPVAIPLQFVVDAAAALMLTLLIGLWLTALATYLLLWEIVRHRGAALLGGLAVALAPTQLYHLLWAQINLTPFFAVPLILLAVLRAIRRRQRRWVIVGALSVLICGLIDWHWTALALLLAGLVVLEAVWRRRRRAKAALQSLAWGTSPVALGLLLLAPLVLAMLTDLRANDNYALRPEIDTAYRSLDLLALVTPNHYHPLWGEAVQASQPTLFPPGIKMKSGWLGLVALLVGGMAVWRRRPIVRLWLVALGFGVLLALGPNLIVNGQPLPAPLPYRLLQLLPVFNVSRTPNLFFNGALLAMAVLLALGLRQLMARAGRGRPATAVLLVVSGLVLFEGLAVPLQAMDRPAVSACYRVLAADPRPGAVLDLPVTGVNEPLYFQTVHGRPIAGGRLARSLPNPFLYETPVLAQLVRGERRPAYDIYLDQPGPLLRHYVAGWGIQWIVLRPPDLGPQARRFEASLAAHLGDLAPVCADDLARLYHLDAQPAVLALGAGWHALEEPREGQPYRWMEGAAEVEVVTPQAGPVHVTLLAWAHQQSRTLDLWVGADHQARLTAPVGRRAELTARLSLPAGRSRLRLVPVEPPIPGGPADPRLISIAISRLSLAPATTVAAASP